MNNASELSTSLFERLAAGIQSFASPGRDDTMSTGLSPDGVIATPRALVFMTGRDCVQYVAASLESLAAQTHRAVEVLFIDDASVDGTGEAAIESLNRHFQGRHQYVRNPERWGKARNASVHLRASLWRGDFVAILDADDRLIDSTVLSQMAVQYRAGKDVVWTNFRTDKGETGCSGPLDPARPPRGQGWRTSHFFSFRSDLLAAVPETYFRDSEGNWLQAACDQAIAVPILDQTRRWCYLPIESLCYTTSNPKSHHNVDPESLGLNSREQMRCSRIVFSKPPLPCRRLPPNVPATPGDIPALGASAAASSTAAADRNPGHAERSDRDRWLAVAASRLESRAPSLVTLALEGAGPLVNVASLWWWDRLLEQAGPAPRILAIGCGALAAPLHALVGGRGGKVTSVLTDGDEAARLYGRLSAAGVDADVRVLELSQVDFYGISARFPALNGSLGDEPLYDIAVVGPEASPDGAAAAVMALPMSASCLVDGWSHVVLWAPAEPGAMDAAERVWKTVVPDFRFTREADGRRALVVRPPAP